MQHRRVREHLLRLRLEYNGGEPFPGALRTHGTENALDVLKDGRYVCMETVSGCRLCGELLDPAYWAAQWVSRQHGGWQQREHEHYHSVCALAQRNKA